MPASVHQVRSRTWTRFADWPCIPVSTSPSCQCRCPRNGMSGSCRRFTWNNDIRERRQITRPYGEEHWLRSEVQDATNRGATGRLEAIDFFLGAGPELLRWKVASSSSITVVTTRFFTMIRQDQVALSFPSRHKSQSMTRRAVPPFTFPQSTMICDEKAALDPGTCTFD